jgi:hypothetical protein
MVVFAFLSIPVVNQGRFQIFDLNLSYRVHTQKLPSHHATARMTNIQRHIRFSGAEKISSLYTIPFLTPHCAPMQW